MLVSAAIRRSCLGLASKTTRMSCFSPSVISIKNNYNNMKSCYSKSFSNASTLLASSDETFANGTVTSYAEEIFNQWLQDPKSVHVSWQIYFSSLQGSRPNFVTPPSIAPNVKIDGYEGDISLAEVPSGEVLDHMKVQLLVRAYQVRGHQLANIDPLGINKRSAEDAPELSHKHYGFTDADLDRKFFLGSGILPALAEKEGIKSLTLREIKEILEKTYCGSIGLEYGHILDRAECNWLREKFETPNKYQYSKDQKHVILDRLVWSDSFERFVSTKYPTEKRFGLEGCESLIPGMKAFVDKSVDLGVESIAFGMPHRGRLNVLSNVVRKPNESIFCKFAHASEDTVEGSGDVKYHLGMSYSRPTPSGKVVNLSLAANPSHLEAVNPIVSGKIRAEQFYSKDEETRSKSVAVLLHGDSAFAGQGVVYESIGLTNLPAYTTGGVVHIIVNNQIGFTTDPRFARSTPYCSDVAKVVQAPIIHVNGDDVEAVVYSMQLAAEYRAKYKKDVVIDIVCYRKHGHNEIDQPGFTQPLMYQRINKIKPVLEKYINQLISEGTMTKDEAVSAKKRVWTILEKNYEDSKTFDDNSKEWISSNWPGFKSPYEISTEILPSFNTGVDKELLQLIGIAASSYPKDFNIHKNLGKILETRKTTLNNETGLDWATAESMAYGSLLAEGKHVRLSGQDVERGTFSQRHALLHDQKSEGTYVPLNNITGGKIKSQSHFSVCNSSLSEFGVLGFELGFSLVSPHQLVLWEAQFGDFANNAQCIIDQFLTSGEQKWLQRSGLTLLLPHGYDGQGPEHSSARMERFLQLADEDPYYYPPTDKNHPKSYYRQHQDCNIQVVYPTVPSNLFHVLRRQVHRDFRKPLIVFESKNILRHPLAKSDLAELADSTQFQRLIPEVLHGKEVFDEIKNYGSQFTNEDPRVPFPLARTVESFSLLPPEEIKTVIFCSGQVYYSLFKAREANNVRDVAIVRVEELNPFPFHEVKSIIDFYPNVSDITWAQEEAQNSGAWSFVNPRLETAVRESNWFKTKGLEYEIEFNKKKVPGGLENARPNGSKGANTFIGGASIRGSSLIRYAGRDIAAAPATGYKTQHIFEDHALTSEALFGGNIIPPVKVESGVPIFRQ